MISIIVLSLGCTKRQENQQATLNFEKSVDIKTKFIDSSSTLTIDVSFPKNMHAYADGEKIGKPIALDIVEKNGWAKVGEPQLPKGNKKPLGSLGESFVVDSPLHISQKLTKGTGEGEAYLHLQVCTKDLCDRPRRHRLSF